MGIGKPYVLILLIGATFVSDANSQTGAAALAAEDVERWLAAYGAAWQSKDADAAAELFTADALYHETPYADPFQGQAGIRDYWARVTADQQDIAFGSEIIGVVGSTGIARWGATFTSISSGARVELNGVFLLEFDRSKRCSVLREWWHVR